MSSQIPVPKPAFIPMRPVPELPKPRWTRAWRRVTSWLRERLRGIGEELLLLWGGIYTFWTLFSIAFVARLTWADVMEMREPQVTTVGGRPLSAVEQAVVMRALREQVMPGQVALFVGVVTDIVLFLWAKDIGLHALLRKWWLLVFLLGQAYRLLIFCGSIGKEPLPTFDDGRPPEMVERPGMVADEMRNWE